jgi:hypothetical protein
VHRRGPPGYSRFIAVSTRMRPWIVSALGCLAVLAVAGVVALLRSGPTTTLGRTEAWMKGTGCAGAVPHPERLPLRRFAGVHPDFDNHARSYVRIECEYESGDVVYEHFASPDALRRTLARSRSIRRTNLCVTGSDALYAQALDHPTSGLCRHLHGRLRRRLEPPCHHPGMSIERYERVAAREDAGAPCATTTH